MNSLTPHAHPADRPVQRQAGKPSKSGRSTQTPGDTRRRATAALSRPVALAALLALGGPAAAADAWHLGLLAHDVPHLWSHFNRESGVDLNAEWTPAWPDRRVGPARLGSQVGVTINSAGDTSFAYAGFNLRFGSEKGWYGRLGLGAAVHDGDTKLRHNDRKALGSSVLFHIPMEIGYRAGKRSVSLYFSHMSNAYLASPNEGLDVIGLRVGWHY